MKRALFAGVVAALLVQAGVAAGSLGTARSAGSVRAWSAAFARGAQPVTLDQALAAARSFDLIVANAPVYRPYVAAMKAANPGLQLFVYTKGLFSSDPSLGEAAYAHDANRNRIRAADGTPGWLLDPLAPQVLSRQLRRAQALLRSSGYDGVFLDAMGTAPLEPANVSGVPINPATGAAWEPTAWLAMTSRFAGDLATQLGVPVIANGLRDGPDYFGGTAALFGNGVSGAMADGWLRNATAPLARYPSEAEWKQDVDAIVDAGRNGGSFLAVTRLWASGTTAQKDAWYRFAVASYLLGNDGNAFLSVSYAPGDGSASRPLDHLDLGQPLGGYEQAYGVYQRSFAHGRVLVNPTARPLAVPLGRVWHTVDGQTVVVLTLSPESAQILVP